MYKRNSYSKQKAKTKVAFTVKEKKLLTHLVKDSKVTVSIKDGSFSAIPVQATGTQAYVLAEIKQGDAEGERRGLNIQPHALNIKFVYRTDTSNVSNQIGRIVVVQSTDSNASTVPPVTDLFVDPTIPWSQLQSDYRKTMKILYDRTTMINRQSFDTTGISEQWLKPQVFNYKFPPNAPAMTYLSALSNSWDSNNIFVYILGTQSSSAQPATVDMTTRFEFA